MIMLGGGHSMSAVIREQHVYVKTPDGLKREQMHPVTEVKAIRDMGDALDGYKTAFIDPDIKQAVGQLRKEVKGIVNEIATRPITAEEIDEIFSTVFPRRT